MSSTPDTPSTDPPADPLLGTLVGDRYRILEPLARGGMGRVYRAMQVQLSREVAVKVLDTAGDVEPRLREDFTRRFLLEASSLAKLNHPNTIVIYDYGQVDDDTYFIAMELLTGRTLRQVMKDGLVDAEHVIKIGAQIAASLAEAHDQGLIHRDLKPGNIFLTKRGDDPEFVKVLDFGLVKHRPETGLDASHTGFMVGTPKYMAPEQIVGDPVSPATDVYGLGATLYHALAGRPPFEADNRFELLVKHADVDPDPISEVSAAQLPDGLEQVILRCLRKRPSERYASMREVAHALLACSTRSGSWPLGGLISAPGVREEPETDDSTRVSKPRPRPTPLETAEAPSQSGVRASTPAPVAPATPAPVAAPAEAPRSQRTLLALVVGALALSVLAVGFVVYRGLEAPAAQPAPAPPPVVAPPPEPAPPEEASEATPAAPVDTVVRLTTEPEGAQVRRDGRDLGDAPLNLVIPSGEIWTLDVSARGHDDRTLTVRGGQRELHVRLEPTRTQRPRRPSAGERDRPRTDRPRTDNRDPWAEEP